MANSYVILCPYKDRCWRCSYSRYLLDVGYVNPPERMLLFCAGYATIEMMPKKGLYAEHMPTMQGTAVNLCPAINGGYGGYVECPEYCKETKRLANLEKGRQRKELYRDARPRVSIPQEIRRAIAKRDRYRCVYCGRYQNQHWNGKAIKCVVDHVVPLALGGHETDENNLAFCCQDCNQAKGISLWEKGCRIDFYKQW